MYVCMYAAPKANVRERNCIVYIVYENVCMYVCMYAAPKANARERNCIVFIVYENVCVCLHVFSAQSKCEGEKLYCIQRPKRAASTPRRQPSRSPANLLNSFLLTPKSLATACSRLKGGSPLGRHQPAVTFWGIWCLTWWPKFAARLLLCETLWQAAYLLPPHRRHGNYANLKRCDKLIFFR